MATPTIPGGHTFPDAVKTKWSTQFHNVMGSILTSCSTVLVVVSVKRREYETNVPSAYILQMSEDTVLDWARLRTIERVERACVLPPTRKLDPVFATALSLPVV